MVSPGRLGYHASGRWVVPLTDAQTLESFERAVRLDSAFAPAYVHLVDLALRYRNLNVARQYVGAQLGLNPRASKAASLRVTDKLLVLEQASSAGMARALDTLSGDALQECWYDFRNWPDSAETAVRLARLFATPRPGFRAYDSTDAGWVLPVISLAYRGHLHQAYSALLGGQPEKLPWRLNFVDLSLAGGIPRDSAAVQFERWRLADDLWTGTALGWWANTGDTASIRDVARRAASLGGPAGKPGVRDSWRYWAAATKPYLALIRHDTAEALHQFAILPDSLCPGCVLERLRRVQILDQRGADREAARLLEQEITSPDVPVLVRVFWELERGRVNERLHRRDKAIAAYGFVANVWRNADPELQPYVAEARAALKRLSAERIDLTTPGRGR